MVIEPFLSAIFSSFGLVAVSEMGDKTQLLAFSLAAKFKRPWLVMGGILVATLLNHGLASALGQWGGAKVSPFWLSVVLGATFIGFGIWTLKPDTLDDSDTPTRFGPFLTTTVLFFLAEMGDKTQLATVALGARFHAIVAVTVGTTFGMLLADGLAVFLGEKLSEKISMNTTRKIAAIIFFLFGIGSLLTAISLANS